MQLDVVRVTARITLVLCLSLIHLSSSKLAHGTSDPHAGIVPVEVSPDWIEVDDGDTVTIDWPDGDREIIRILGIDTPEIQHYEHNLPLDQPYGREATAFAKGAFAVADQVQLLRAPEKDPYGRTLGYLIVNDRNYSVLVIRARLAVETVSHYGDNGFPEQAAACLAAAEETGPVPFEPPHQFRTRMRQFSDWMREAGRMPAAGR